MYEKACKGLSEAMSLDHSKHHQVYFQKEKKLFKDSKKRFEREEERFSKIETKYKPQDPKYRHGSLRFKREESRFEEAKKRYRTGGPRQTLKFARLDIEPYQITFLAMTAFVALLLVFLFLDFFLVVPIYEADNNNDGFIDADKNNNGINDLLETLEPEYEYLLTDDSLPGDERIVTGYYGGPSIGKVFLFVLGPTLLIPLLSMYLIVTYPNRRARKVRAQNIGRMPEAVGYMTISMRLNPSLPRSVEFAADNVDQPLAGDLRQVLWNVYTNRFPSVEESYLDFAYRWGEWNEDFKRSLYAVRSSLLESTPTGLKRVLDKANTIILEGTQNQIETYLGSLTGPTMILFALGVLLPLTFASLLPILGLGKDQIPLVILMMNILFPGLGLAYGRNILDRRPATMLPPNIPSPMTRGQKQALAFVCILMAIILIGVGVAVNLHLLTNYSSGGSELYALLASLPIIWGIGLPLSIYMGATSKDQLRELNAIQRLEEEFPDALFALGSRIAEGKPFEYAVSRTAESLKGSEISTLFRRMSYSTRVTQGSLKEVILGRHGLLKDYPSKSIRAVMMMLIETSNKDSRTAGQTIIDISRYQRDLRRAERRVQNELNKVIGTMKATGMIFAPLIMGVTAALYFMLVKNLPSSSDMPSGGSQFGMSMTLSMTDPIPPGIFSLIIGVYLISTVIIITMFTSGIQYGEDWVRRKSFLSKAIPIALIVYSASLIISNILLG